jgi:hypothetical protein
MRYVADELPIARETAAGFGKWRSFPAEGSDAAMLEKEYADVSGGRDEAGLWTSPALVPLPYW